MALAVRAGQEANPSLQDESQGALHRRRLHPFGILSDEGDQEERGYAERRQRQRGTRGWSFDLGVLQKPQGATNALAGRLGLCSEASSSEPDNLAVADTLNAGECIFNLQGGRYQPPAM